MSKHYNWNEPKMKRTLFYAFVFLNRSIVIYLKKQKETFIHINNY